MAANFYCRRLGKGRLERRVHVLAPGRKLAVARITAVIFMRHRWCPPEAAHRRSCNVKLSPGPRPERGQSLTETLRCRLLAGGGRHRRGEHLVILVGAG